MNPILPHRVAPPPPDPADERFVAKLAVPPLDWPNPVPADFTAQRRAEAEHLCLWMACSRVVCRRGRHCLGARAECVFENAEVKRPILEEVVRATYGPR
jgi:hypothetical protein